MEKTINILLVDDKPENLLALEGTLTAPDYHLMKAESGQEALRLLMQEKDIALIILDVQMPEMDGFELAGLLQQNERTKTIPIIFLSAIYVEHVDIFKGYELGAFDYLTKPFAPEVLKSKVAVFVRLFRLTEEKVVEERERARELEAALEAQRNFMKTEEQTGAEGKETLAQRTPNIFTQCQLTYGTLLEEYLEAISFNRPPPRLAIRELAERIGLQMGGPRDVIELHMSVVDKKSQKANPRRVKAYTSEGRLLALELMGYLTDYYRRS